MRFSTAPILAGALAAPLASAQDIDLEFLTKVTTCLDGYELTPAFNCVVQTVGLDQVANVDALVEEAVSTYEEVKVAVAAAQEGGDDPTAEECDAVFGRPEVRLVNCTKLTDAETVISFANDLAASFPGNENCKVISDLVEVVQPSRRQLQAIEITPEIQEEVKDTFAALTDLADKCDAQVKDDLEGIAEDVENELDNGATTTAAAQLVGVAAAALLITAA